MKPYQQIPILDCGELLVPIPLEQFAVESPHAYAKVGAPYGERSPYYLRESVLASLIHAQKELQQHYPNWRIQIFDAYRPVEVQQFMVNYTFIEAAKSQGLNPDELTQDQRQHIFAQVYQIWAIPSFDLATPPPHSTGGAVDVTLVDDKGEAVDMGSPIDEMSVRSHPDYFANSSEPAQQQYHAHRQLLHQIMQSAGFLRHPSEWWHFSQGDQMWAWLYNQANPIELVRARYGRVDGKF
jgi:zinc D-Ala-D-Ala dipeptidase